MFFVLLYHRFSITLEELDDGEDIANCPSCTLKVRVIYEPEVLDKYKEQLEATGTSETTKENGDD